MLSAFVRVSWFSVRRVEIPAAEAKFLGGAVTFGRGEHLSASRDIPDAEA